MNSKEVKTNCSFCGKEIPCPENMVKSQKHACYKCFLELKEKMPNEEIEKIHVAIPKEQLQEAMPDLMLQYAMQKIFPEFWSNHKSRLKNMSQKEIAEEAFLAGASITMSLKKGFEQEMLRNK